MSRTKHHNDGKDGRELHLTEKYTGYIGENCWRQRGRKFLKRWQHRANRRHAATVLRRECSVGNPAGWRSYV